MRANSPAVAVEQRDPLAHLHVGNGIHGRGDTKAARSLDAGAGEDPFAVGMNCYDRTVAIERVTVSLDAELAAAIRDAAAEQGENVSAWLADAARRRLSARGLGEVVARWERKHGALKPDELAEARRRLRW